MSARGEAAMGAVAAPQASAPPRERARPQRESPTVPAGPPRGTARAKMERGAGVLPTTITLETALYVVIILLAVATRFWDLNSRALHHDESLHTYYSWLYATGEGYRHDPLMHGPFLFHANALVYLLFGDSDASSRFMPALFGVALVALPALLRGPRHLGRWGALATSALLLVSPALTYYSRFIRHDIYTVVGTFLLFICLVRYLEKPERRWLVTGGVTIALLLANHEIIFAILVIFFGFLYGGLLWGRLRAWWPTRPEATILVAGVHAAALLIGLALILFTPAEYKDRLLDIPWQDPTPAERNDYYRRQLTNPLVIGFVTLAIGFVVGLRVVLEAGRDPRRRDEGLVESLLGDAPDGSIEAGVRNAWRDKTTLAITVVAGVIIFVALFTSLFTNLDGLGTATFETDGMILYWLGQQDYRRGEQPWFYYLLLMPQYEFVAVALGGAATVATLWRALGGLTGRWKVGSNLCFRLFLVVWFLLIFAGLTYAGEKMPWLIIHITLPATVLAGALIGGLVERAVALRDRTAAAAFGWQEWGLFAALLADGGSWLVLAADLTNGQFVQPSTGGGWRRTLTDYAADRWWWLAVPPAAALILLGGSFLWRGPRRAGEAALAALAIGLVLLQIHAGWRLVYLEGDVPRDMLVYTQTSPDVERVVEELGRLSAELTGGKEMAIWYDSGVSWPMQWYLRDFPNKRYFGASIAGPPDDAPVLLVAETNYAGVEQQLDGYTAQEYVLRWWFPEDETYRNFAMAPELNPGRSAWKRAEDPPGPLEVARSVIDGLATQRTMAGQQRLFRLVMYRDLPGAIGQYNFRLYIRNDLLPLFNGIRY